MFYDVNKLLGTEISNRFVNYRNIKKIINLYCIIVIIFFYNYERTRFRIRYLRRIVYASVQKSGFAKSCFIPLYQPDTGPLTFITRPSGSNFSGFRVPKRSYLTRIRTESPAKWNLAYVQVQGNFDGKSGHTK